MPDAPPRAPRLRRWLLLAAALAALAALAAPLLRPAPLAVELGTVARDTVRATIEAEGRTRLAHRHLLAAPVTGELVRIERRAGDPVREGEAVAELRPAAAGLLDPRAREEARQRVGTAEAAMRQAEASLARARAASELATRELARSRRLVEAGAMARQEFEQLVFQAEARAQELVSARASADMARHEVALARAALGITGRTGSAPVAVRSPMDGVILRVLAENEGTVPAGTPLVELGEPGTIEVELDVLSEDAVRLPPRAEARVTGWGGTPVAAHVRRVAPAAFTKRSSLGMEEQRVHVVLEPDSLPSPLAAAGDGYRVEATLTLARTGPVRSAPVSALVRRGSGWAVYRVRDGRAALVPVTTGLVGSTRAEIREGLADGDQVVLFPPEELAEGTRVTAR